MAGNSNGIIFFWKYGKLLAVPEEKFNQTINLKFTWNVSNIFKEILKPDRNTKVKYVKIQPNISALTPRGGVNSISDPSNFKLFFYDTLNEGEEKAYANLNTEKISKAAENASAELRAAFLDNLTTGPSIWKEVSNERLNRRSIMTSLGSTTQLPVDPSVHYTESVFKKVIDSYKYTVTNDAKKNILKIELKSDKLPNAPHPDFVGWKSGFKGPNEILLSIMGLQVKNNSGISKSGNNMIVPITRENYGDWSRTSYRKQVNGDWKTINLGYEQKAMAYIGGGYPTIKYPSKNTPEPPGIPVMFVLKINTKPYYFQDANNESKRRVVFWSKEKIGGTITFPKNVLSVLKKNGFLSKEYNK
jgi:hypothetical protein